MRGASGTICTVAYGSRIRTIRPTLARLGRSDFSSIAKTFCEVFGLFRRIDTITPRPVSSVSSITSFFLSHAREAGKTFFRPSSTSLS